MKEPGTEQNKIQALRLPSLFLVASVGIMGIKFWAYERTGSHAILSDALESIVNVVAGAFALYSLWWSMRPRDQTHPYGHGKIEFLSAGVEGGLIFMAGMGIVYESVQGLLYPSELKQLDLGILLVALAGAANGLLGFLLLRHGRNIHSSALQADGHHLLSDAYTSAGLLVGLAVAWFTGIVWLDSALALAFAGLLLFTGYRLVRRALAGLMDAADMELLPKVIQTLAENRRPRWIDIHNLRVVQYGGSYHIDAHLTLPWYVNLEEAHEEVTAMEHIAATHFHDALELFVHADPCIPTSCSICSLDCAHRTSAFQESVPWTLSNVLSNQKHRLPTA